MSSVGPLRNGPPKKCQILLTGADTEILGEFFLWENNYFGHFLGEVGQLKNHPVHIFSKVPFNDAPQRCPSMMPLKDAPQGYPSKMPLKDAPQRCPSRLPLKDAPQRYPSKMILKDAPQRSPSKMPLKDASQRCPSMMPLNDALQRCPSLSASIDIPGNKGSKNHISISKYCQTCRKSSPGGRWSAFHPRPWPPSCTSCGLNNYTM